MGMCGTDVGCHVWFNFRGMKLSWMHSFTFLHFIGVDAANCISAEVTLYICTSIEMLQLLVCVRVYVCVCDLRFSTVLRGCCAKSPNPQALW